MYIPRTYDATGDFSETYPSPPGGWVCFHCGARFSHQGPARRHFGMKPDEIPLCLRKEMKMLKGPLTEEQFSHLEAMIRAIVDASIKSHVAGEEHGAYNAPNQYHALQATDIEHEVRKQAKEALCR